MIGWIENVKIGARVGAAAVLPLLGMTIYAGFTMAEKHAASREMTHVEDLAHLAPTVSALVHEMQQERGKSAGFLGSRGKDFAEHLPLQRQATEERDAELRAAIQVFTFEDHDESMRAAAKKGLAASDKLAEVRAGVDAFATSEPEMAAY